MKAISLWQPWASLWLSPHKVHETRHWPINLRGWLAVHAAKKIVKDVDRHLEFVIRNEFGEAWKSSLPTGSLIGLVYIAGCRRTEEIRKETTPADLVCGNFDDGRFGWYKQAYRSFKTPIPWVGRQGLFNVPDHICEAE